MGDRVGPDVERIVILGFVDPDAPQYDRRVVPVLQHHLFHVLTGDVLPGFVSDMLPARDLGKDQESQLVAGVDEGLGLRIMGSPDDRAAELFLEDPGVFPLQGVADGISDVRIALVSVETSHNDSFAVEIESVRLEADRP